MPTFRRWCCIATAIKPIFSIPTTEYTGLRCLCKLSLKSAKPCINIEAKCNLASATSACFTFAQSTRHILTIVLRSWRQKSGNEPAHATIVAVDVCTPIMPQRGQKKCAGWHRSWTSLKNAIPRLGLNAVDSQAKTNLLKYERLARLQRSPWK